MCIIKTVMYSIFCYNIGMKDYLNERVPENKKSRLIVMFSIILFIVIFLILNIIGASVYKNKNTNFSDRHFIANTEMK